MVGGPAIVFCRYHEQDVTGIRTHAKNCKTILGLAANMRYTGNLGFDFPVGKENLIKLHRPKATESMELLTKGVEKGSLFDFAQDDIGVPLEPYKRFSEMSPLFSVKEKGDTRWTDSASYARVSSTDGNKTYSRHT